MSQHLLLLSKGPFEPFYTLHIIVPELGCCRSMRLWAGLNFAFLYFSRKGLILGILLAVAAPLTEAVTVALGLWHYKR